MDVGDRRWKSADIWDALEAGDLGEDKDIYLWRKDTCAARPPKDDAIVLNSTCLILGTMEGSVGSTCTM